MHELSRVKQSTMHKAIINLNKQHKRWRVAWLSCGAPYGSTASLITPINPSR